MDTNATDDDVNKPENENDSFAGTNESKEVDRNFEGVEHDNELIVSRNNSTSNGNPSNDNEYSEIKEESEENIEIGLPDDDSASGGNLISGKTKQPRDEASSDSVKRKLQENDPAHSTVTQSKHDEPKQQVVKDKSTNNVGTSESTNDANGNSCDTAAVTNVPGSGNAQDTTIIQTPELENSSHITCETKEEAEKTKDDAAEDNEITHRKRYDIDVISNEKEVIRPTRDPNITPNLPEFTRTNEEKYTGEGKTDIGEGKTDVPPPTTFENDVTENDKSDDIPTNQNANILPHQNGTEIPNDSDRHSVDRLVIDPASSNLLKPDVVSKAVKTTQDTQPNTKGCTITPEVNTARSTPKIPTKPPNMTLVFHAVVPACFCTKPDNVRLFFDKHKYDDVVMKQIRRLDGDIIQLEGTAHIYVNSTERQRLQTSGIVYSYAIMTNENNYLYEEEIGPSIGFAKGEKIRRVQLVQHKKCKELHQYDGMLQKNKSILDNFRKGNLIDIKSGFENLFTKDKKLLEEGNEIAMIAFTPSTGVLKNNIIMTAADLLKRVEQVHLCAQDWFVDSEKRHSHRNHYLDIYIQREIEKFTHAQNEGSPTNDCLIQALTLVYLLAKYDKQAKGDANCLLFKSLLMKATSGTLKDEYELIRHHFAGTTIQKDLCNCLSNYIIKNRMNLLHEWIYALPIYICLSGELVHTDVLTPKLLGLEQLRTIKDRLVKEIEDTQFQSELERCINEMSHLFDKEPSLPNLVMDFMSVDQIDRIAQHGCFPSESLFLLFISYTKQRSAKHGLENVKNNINNWIEQLGVAHPDELNGEKLITLFRMSVDHVSHVCKQKQTQFKFEHMVKEAIDIVTRLGKACFNLVYSEQRQNRVRELWDTLLQAIIEWLKKKYFPQNGFTIEILKGTNTLEVLKYLLGIRMPTRDLQEVWCKEITSHLEAGLKRFDTDTKMQIFCNLEPVCAEIDICFQNAALNAIHAVIQGKLPKWIREDCHKQNPKAVILVSAYFKSYLKKNSDKTTLEIILEWPEFLNLFRLLSRPNLIVDDETAKLVSESKLTLERVSEGLEQSSVTLDRLMYLIDKREILHNIWNRIYGHECRQLEKCIQDYEEFKLLNGQVYEFISLCDKDTLDIYEFEYRPVDGFKSNTIATIWTRNEKGIMFISEYNIPLTLMECLPDIVNALRVAVFAKIFHDICQRLNDKLTLEEVGNKVWPKAKNEIKFLSRKLFDGSIKLANIDAYFGAFKGNLQGLEDEIKEIAKYSCVKKPELIHERLSQIMVYFCADSYQATANIYLQLRDTLQLTGDFEIINIIMNIGGRAEQPISVIPKELIHTIPVLEVHQIECLKTFLECMDLVRWMNAKIKGPQGIKYLADLAMSSAEDQGDCEVEKVNNLLGIVSFGPLMFQLDRSAGYVELARNSKYVFDALETDQKLAEKLVTTTENLNWLESVHESITSIEANTIDTAIHILENGSFSVGNIYQLETIKTIDDLIRIDLKRQRKGYTKTTYNLDELTDIHSKLVLIAGPSHKHFERTRTFGEIYDVMTRIGKPYLALCLMGSNMFKNMIIKFDCSNAKGTVHIDMKLKDINPVRKFADTWVGVLEDLKKIAKKLNVCLDKMFEEISKQRKEFSQLNYFTTKQLVILRRKLNSIGQWVWFKTNVDDICPILQSIKNDVAYGDLKKCMKRAKQIISSGKTITNDSEEQEKGKLDEDFQYEDMHETEDSAGFISQLLKRITSLIPEEMCGRRRNPWTENPYLVEEELPEMPPRSLDILLQVWELYVTIYDDGMITLEHLGLFLQQLEEMGPGGIQRSIQPPFIKGKPNLIVCPQGEMYERLLSIYMYENGQMPTADEVLLCTAKTTDEEVTLLFYRAVGSSTCKGIHCLVNPDLLEYSVANTTLQQLDKLTAGTADYQLIVLCSQENENKSLYVSTLDKYRVTTPYQESHEHIKRYIQDFLHVQESRINGYISLACVDRQRSSVRVLRSAKAGCGKTLRKNRCHRETIKSSGRKVAASTVTIHSRSVNLAPIHDALREATAHKHPVLIHIDVAHEVEFGLDNLLFNVIILGCLKDESGLVWRRRRADLILVENVPLLEHETGANNNSSECRQTRVHQLLGMLPAITCQSPQDCQQPTIQNDPENQTYDQEELLSEYIQRPCWYLDRTDHNDSSDIYAGQRVRPILCIGLLLRHCGLSDPSWAELGYFAHFLNEQLKDCENSVYCNPMFNDVLPGFKSFVVKFMIQMSKDFATRSLAIAEETPSTQEDVNVDLLAGFEMKRKWESSPHPYIFFNKDGNTMTFLGFNIEESSLNLIDLNSGRVLEQRIITQQLYTSLKNQDVNLSENMHDITQEEKLDKLRRVFGVEDLGIDERSYELTMDNLKKILAIDMRFKCGIPVIIMGETGCGKTRLVEFMCNIKKPRGIQAPNMIILKVHGGTTERDIIACVNKALQLAKSNSKKHGIKTVLFFDEANTTEAIGLIREIMCNRTMNGQSLKQLDCLQLVATCNPYRRHSDDMIKKLEEAGLGYHTSAGETKEKLGRIPMRRLVYRVQPLPHSMIPLVWDFGQLSDNDELLYIKQMVNSFVDAGANGRLDLKSTNPDTRCAVTETISKILTTSQQFMRHQKDECSFVSLRNIERVLKVIDWFYQHRELLFEKVDEKWSNFNDTYQHPSDITRCIINALAVCYQSCLQNVDYRERYRQAISQHMTESPCQMQEPIHENILLEIKFCQEVFLDELQLGLNIAKNNALRENVFMMVVCIELRIPLFLVGKPGSSKSLARSIVTDAMQGSASRSDLYRKFKDTSMLSFQCSPLSTPEGIIATFRQCANLQSKRDANKFASVVILEEVGLAEDSPSMPLKTLHPLLEEGAPDDRNNLQKVGFIGISNWALDPAKMNRGILVQRCVPDGNELLASAMGICATDVSLRNDIQDLLEKLSIGFLRLIQDKDGIREFFGLRDFYSLIKMVYDFAAKHNGTITMNQLVHAIKRNFSGLETTDAITFLTNGVNLPETLVDEPALDNSDVGLIKASLKGDFLELRSDQDCPCRYLLLLTENNAALTILDQHLLDLNDTKIIYGSSFPRDQEYTQVCRNINKIKIHMATGKTVVLINTDNLYESLYDVLNQYYETLGTSQFVSLGLGTHRVKCKVDKAFRLIVVAEKEHVFQRFPIPLINRLEKHYLAMATILSDAQKQNAQQLEEWMKHFACPPNSGPKKLKVEDVFIGYYPDAVSAVLLDQSGQSASQGEVKDMDIQKAKETLLQCATPEAVLKQKNNPQMEWTIQVYFEQQEHSCLQNFLRRQILQNSRPVFVQVLTHSKLLSMADAEQMTNALGFGEKTALTIGLQEFDTEYEFTSTISGFFNSRLDQECLLIIQCMAGDQYAELIACARYIVANEYEQALEQNGTNDIHSGRIHVVFIIHLPRKSGGCFNGFQGGRWLTTFIDELRSDITGCPPLMVLQDIPLSTALENGLLKNDITKGFSNEYISDLIRRCIHAAGNLVKDTTVIEDAKLQRVQLVIDLMDNFQIKDPKMVFSKIFIERMVMLMKEREETSMNPTNWLIRDVAHKDKVTCAGTLRKSLQLCLESKITPLLAGLMCFLSTNKTLQIPDKITDSWIQQLWLAMFSDPGITSYKYDDIRTALNGTELTQLNVTHHWQNPFHSQFPFSWLIIEQLEDLMHTCRNMEDSDTKMFNAFESSRLSKLLIKIIPRNCTQAIKLFLDDFVRQLYKPVSNISEETETQVVTDALQSTAGLDMNCYEEASFCNIYQAYYKIRTPIQNFRMLLEIDCLQIHQILNRLDYRTSNSNPRLDIQALDCVVRYIKAHNHELQQDLQTWMGRFRKCYPVVKTAITYIENDPTCGNCRVFNGVTSDWAIFQTVFLFVECVLASSLEAEKLLKSKPDALRKTLDSLDRPLDFKHVNLINAVIKCIAKCSSDVKSRENEEGILVHLQRAMDSFFMQLVSQYCFHGPIPPTKDVIDTFLDYVTKNTGKSHFIFTTKALKPSPVIKFFLLKLLLRYRSVDVHEYLQSYFNEELNTKNIRHKLQTFGIVVHCFEDSYNTQMLSVENTADYICQEMKQARRDLLRTELKYQIPAIARARHSLGELADLLYQCGDTPDLTAAVCREAQQLLTNEAQCAMPKHYLIKVIGRRYGMNTLKSLLKEPNLRWMSPERLNLVQEDTRDDRFVVWGQEYQQTREFIIDKIADKNCQKRLADFVQTLHINVDLALVLVTFRLNILCYCTGAISLQNLQIVGDMVADCNISSSAKELISKTLNNTEDNILLRTKRDLKDTHLSLLEIVQHFKAVFFTTPVEPVLRMFATLVYQPQLLENTYLPTMPEDMRDQVKSAFPGMQLWNCPNGHPYVIGECGKPMETATCHCGALIGGKNHTARSGNTADLERHETKTGHILGLAKDRQRINSPERDLSAAKVTIIRLLMHTAMFIGADINPEAICNMMHTSNSQHSVSKEMWSHMALDLSILKSTLQVSLDDCCLFVHRVLMVMGNARSSNRDDGSWRRNMLTKEGRRQWENDIDHRFLSQLFEIKDRLITQDNDLIAGDKQNADSTLRNMVFKTSDYNESETDNNRIYDNPAMWKYRKPVTLQHFKDAVDSCQKKTFSVRLLRHFFKKEQQLQWIRYIPNIEKLHLLLSQICYAKLDKKEASEMTIRQFLSTTRGQLFDELEKLIQCYCDVWNGVRVDLQQMEFPGQQRIPDIYLQDDITEQSSLAFLLPTVRGQGLCALGLLAYLCRVHNDFVEEYATLKKTPCETSVNLRDVTTAHVIGFESEKDLLPIILANCNHSFHEETNAANFEYDFHSVARQMEQRFLYGKPRIRFEFQNELMVFKTELTNAAQFQQLEHRIPQERLSQRIRQQMQKDNLDIADVVDLLSILDVAIGFIISTKPDQNKVVGDFIWNTLDKAFPLPGQCGDMCKVKHVKSLWILLSQLRAQILTQNGHEPFDTVDEKYKQSLSTDQVQNLHSALRQTDMGVFVAELYQCIILRISVSNDPNSEDYVDNVNHPLGYTLQAYTETEMSILEDGIFPEDITASQCIETWCEAFTYSLRYANI